MHQSRSLGSSATPSSPGTPTDLTAEIWYHQAVSVRAVIFDLGHTLWDVKFVSESLASVHEEIRRRLQQASPNAVPETAQLQEALEERFRQDNIAYLTEGKLVQVPAQQLVEEGLGRLGVVPGQPLLAEITALLVDGDLIRIHADDDTGPTLAALKDRGLRLGAVSNTYSSGQVIRRQLAERGLLPYLDSVVASSDVLVLKPHPAIFRRALEELEVRPEEAVFVGDSLIADVRGAQALGIRGVLSHQYRQEDPKGPPPDAQVQGLKPWLDGRPPDHIIERLAEIVDYVEGLNSADGPT